MSGELTVATSHQTNMALIGVWHRRPTGLPPTINQQLPAYGVGAAGK
jgi:hypothetical protein